MLLSGAAVGTACIDWSSLARSGVADTHDESRMAADTATATCENRGRRGSNHQHVPIIIPRSRAHEPRQMIVAVDAQLGRGNGGRVAELYMRPHHGSVQPPTAPAVPRRADPAQARGSVTRGATAWRAPGFALVATFWAYPLLWLLGLQVAAWPVTAILLAAWLLRHRWRVYVPRGFGLWLLFLGWTVISVAVLDSPDRMAGWGYRAILYLAATVVLVFLVNVDEHELPTARLAHMLIALWVSTIVGAYIGIVLPDLQFTSLTESLAPALIKSDPFIFFQVHPRFGDEADFLQTVRPAALFSYTNSWGAALALLTPMAIDARQFLASARARAALWIVAAASLVPIVISVNRGLWIGLVVAPLFVAVRSALARRPGHLVAVVVGLGMILLTVWLSPLRDIIEGRLERPNTGTRETLASASLELVAQSPLIGYGAPVTVSALADANDVSVGTHGQLWTLLVSHGVPGAVFYFGFFAAVIVVTWRIPATAWWTQASIIVFITQAPFYTSVPVPLVLVMIAIALCLRAAHRPWPTQIRDRQSASNRVADTPAETADKFATSTGGPHR